MIKIQDITDQTGLKKHFVYRCLRDMDEIFNPLTQRGSHNCKIFDSNVITLFDQIKQLKEQGHSVPSIKKKLLEQLAKHQKPTIQAALNGNDGSVKSSSEQKDSTVHAVLELTEKLQKAEIARIEAQSELQQIKANLKLLPTSDPNKAKRMIGILSMLEGKTKAKFFENREVKNLWRELKDILYKDDVPE